MYQARILPYLGPAIVFYLVAWVVSLKGELDAVGYATAVVALLLSLAGFLGNRRTDIRGAQRIVLLTACAATALVTVVRPRTLSLTLELAHLVSLSGFAALITDLALSVPDRVWPRMHPYTARVLPYLVALVCAGCGFTVYAPLVMPFGEPLLVPTWLATGPEIYAAIALPFALGVRLLRSRFGSGPEELASNNWAVLGLVPASVVVAALALFDAFQILDSTDGVYRGALAVTGICVVLGHLFMVDKRRQLSAGKAERSIVAAALTLALMALFVMTFRLHVPQEPWQLVLLFVATLLASTGAFLGFQPIVTRLLAPFGGRLLQAIDLAIEQLNDARTLDDVARAVLVPMRRATAAIDSEPLLYCFDPQLEARINVAGQSQLAPRRFSDVVVAYLRERPSEIVLRGSLEAMIIRRPPFRPLVDALVNLDALCVVPLMTAGELEGALVIPRGNRTSTLTLEEIAALRRFSRFLATFISVLCAELRAQKRVNDAIQSSHRVVEEINQYKRDVARLRSEVRVLKSNPSNERLNSSVIAYSPAARALLEQLDNTSSTSDPVLLVAESGTFLHPLAYRIHEQSDRKAEAFVIGDCSTTNGTQGGIALFGEKEGTGDYPGWLPLAQGGCLLLLDLPALPREVQRSLAWALAIRQAQRTDSDQVYPIDVKIIATTRVVPSGNSAPEALDPELFKRFSPCVVRVPPLRERQEDLDSLILLELDRAARVLGREVVGIESQALAILRNHRWPGNQEELRFVIQKAVENCHDERIQETDLPFASTTESAISQESLHLEGTLEVVERRIIEQAMTTAAGNKSEAARILGLKRTTFLDKLRRHSLD